jgi:tRNA-dihydrouridine synthase
MAVDRHVGDVVEQLGRPVAPFDLGEKLGRGVDETGRIGIVAKARMGDDRLQEGEIGRHAANAEFAQRPVHARDRLLRRRGPGGHLLKQRIVEAGDDRA